KIIEHADEIGSARRERKLPTERPVAGVRLLVDENGFWAGGRAGDERRARRGVRQKRMPLKHVVISGNQNRRIELGERRAATLRFVKIIRAETIGVRAGRAVISSRSGGRRKN